MMPEPNGPVPILAKSTAGHDAGCYYLLLRSDEDYVYLADGRHRRLSHPKRKNRKHVKRIYDPSGREIPYDGTMLTDRYVRKWLSMFRNGETAGNGKEELL